MASPPWRERRSTRSWPAEALHLGKLANGGTVQVTIEENKPSFGFLENANHALRQHFLYFFPLPHGQSWLRPTFLRPDAI